MEENPNLSKLTYLVAARRKLILDEIITGYDKNNDATDEEIESNLMSRLYDHDQIMQKATERKKNTIRLKKLHNVERNSVEYKQEYKWNDYDIMKSRWRYIKPQMTQLLDDRSMIIPRRNDSPLVTTYIHNNDMSMNGNFASVKRVTELLNKNATI
jgi:hypothetical protein